MSIVKSDIMATENGLSSINAQTNAYNVHNEYLDFLCTKVASRELDRTMSPESIMQFRTLTKLFFSTKYSCNIDSFIDERIDGFFEYYSDVEEKRAKFKSSEISTIITDLESLVLSDLSVSDFTIQTNTILNSGSNVSTSLGLNSIIGVAQGSYKYWKELPSNTCYIENTSIRKCRLCLFALSDLAGAADGAALGTILGGVGAGPGAVMGGAIYSGLTALSWD